VPVAHVDDSRAVEAVCATLRDLHGRGFDFAVRRWDGETALGGPEGRVVYRFVVRAERARVSLPRGALVRGVPPEGAFRPIGGDVAAVEAPERSAAIWPGDVLTAGGGQDAPLVVSGRGLYFEVLADASGYPAPALVLLRHLPDHPRGCAAHAGAFRREALPPARADSPATPALIDDRRGVNRVNEHTLDMRYDRPPGPTTHYHGPVPCGEGGSVSHSETAIVLPRGIYGLPEVGGTGGEADHAVLYRRPAEDPQDQVVMPVRPGSIVVTPGAAGWTMGHRFENAFAMLVAIPGFVAPTTYLDAAHR
jgi:hypothetical protein